MFHNDETLVSAHDTAKTHDTLCNYFTTNGTIDTSELNHAIILHIKTNKELQYQLSNNRRTPSQIVWQALINLANESLSMEYGRKYTATQDSLLQWLKEYGEGEEELRESIEYVESL